MSKAMNTLLAAAAGFAAGILLAPKSGEETRQEIRDKARGTKEYLDEKTNETVGVVKESLSHAEAEARDMAKSARRSAQTVANEASLLNNEARVRMNRVAETAKQAAKKD